MDLTQRVWILGFSSSSNPIKPEFAQIFAFFGCCRPKNARIFWKIGKTGFSAGREGRKHQVYEKFWEKSEETTWESKHSQDLGLMGFIQDFCRQRQEWAPGSSTFPKNFSSPHSQFHFIPAFPSWTKSDPSMELKPNARAEIRFFSWFFNPKKKKERRKIQGFFSVFPLSSQSCSGREGNSIFPFFLGHFLGLKMTEVGNKAPVLSRSGNCEWQKIIQEMLALKRGQEKLLRQKFPEKNGILAALLCPGGKNMPNFWECWIFWDWGNTGISQSWGFSI